MTGVWFYSIHTLPRIHLSTFTNGKVNNKQCYHSRMVLRAASLKNIGIIKSGQRNSVFHRYLPINACYVDFGMKLNVDTFSNYFKCNFIILIRFISVPGHSPKCVVQRRHADRWHPPPDRYGAYYRNVPRPGQERNPQSRKWAGLHRQQVGEGPGTGSCHGDNCVVTGGNASDDKVVIMTVIVPAVSALVASELVIMHDDVIKWKRFPRYWPFVRGIHRSPVNSLHKVQWRRALMLSLICVWINAWVNNREAGDLRRHRAHYDVIVMGIPWARTGILVYLWILVKINSIAQFRIVNWACVFHFTNINRNA